MAVDLASSVQSRPPALPAAPPVERSWLRRAVRLSTPAALYLAVAAYLVSPALLHPEHRAVGSTLTGVNQDPYLMQFFLGWTPWALAHGHSPLFTTVVRAPHGANLMWNNWMPLAALVLAPVTLTLGAVVSYNVLIVLGFTASATAAYVLARRITSLRGAALLLGAVYGFSPYMLAHGQGHPPLLLTWYPPVVLLVLDDLRVGRRIPRATGLLLAAATVAQFLVDEELVVTTAIFAALLLGALRLSGVPVDWRRLFAALRWSAVALPPLMCLVGFQLFGPAAMDRPLFSAAQFSADPLGFVLPPATLVLAEHHGVLARTLGGNPTENGTYLLPLLVLTATLTRQHLRDPLVRVALTVAAVMTVLSLGPSLTVGARSTGVPLPGVLLFGLPGLANILPIRLMLFVYLALCAAAARGIDLRYRGRPLRPGSRVAAVGAMSLLVPLPLATVPVGIPSYFTSAAVRSEFPPGAMTVIGPPAQGGSGAISMVWQAATGFRLRTADGYIVAPTQGLATFPPPHAALTLLRRIVLGDSRAPDGRESTAIRADLRRLDVKGVIIGPMPHERAAVLAFETVLGRPAHRTGGVYLWLL